MYVLCIVNNYNLNLTKIPLSLSSLSSVLPPSLSPSLPPSLPLSLSLSLSLSTCSCVPLVLIVEPTSVWSHSCLLFSLPLLLKCLIRANISDLMLCVCVSLYFTLSHSVPIPCCVLMYKYIFLISLYSHTV